MPRMTLSGSGYVLPSDSKYSKTTMTGSGRAAPPGAQFVAAKVLSISGGSSPTIEIRNGVSPNAPLVRSVSATLNAEIDQRSAPDPCVNGLWLQVTGSPTAIQVEVLFR